VKTPLVERVRVSTKPPAALRLVVVPTAAPAGSRIEIFVLQHVGPTWRLTR
jgi:hypothetical protein